MEDGLAVSPDGNLQQPSTPEAEDVEKALATESSHGSNEAGLRNHARDRFFEDNFDDCLRLFQSWEDLPSSSWDTYEPPWSTLHESHHWRLARIVCQVPPTCKKPPPLVLIKDLLSDVPKRNFLYSWPLTGSLSNVHCPVEWTRMSAENYGGALNHYDGSRHGYPYGPFHPREFLQFERPSGCGYWHEGMGGTMVEMFNPCVMWNSSTPLLPTPPAPSLQDCDDREAHRPSRAPNVRKSKKFAGHAVRRLRPLSPSCTIPKTESWDDEADDRTIEIGFREIPAWLLPNVLGCAVPAEDEEDLMGQVSSQPRFELSPSAPADPEGDQDPGTNNESGPVNGLRSPENSLSNDSWDREVGMESDEEVQHPVNLGRCAGDRVGQPEEGGGLGLPRVAVAVHGDEVPRNAIRNRISAVRDAENEDGGSDDDGGDAPVDDLVYLHPPPDDPNDLLADDGPGSLPLPDGDAPANKPDPTRRRIYNGPLPEGLLPALSPHDFAWSPVEGQERKRFFWPWTPGRRSHLVRLHHESPSFKILRYESPDDSNNDGYCEAVPT